jgi:hypothetical protein
MMVTVRGKSDALILFFRSTFDWGEDLKQLHWAIEFPRSEQWGSQRKCVGRKLYHNKDVPISPHELLEGGHHHLIIAPSTGGRV